MYCLWPLLFMCLTIVLVYSILTLVNCTSQLLIHVPYNSVSVYYFYYYISKLYLLPTRGEESPWTTSSHWRQKQQTNFFSSFHTSLRLLLWLALHEGHVICLWPLPHLLLVCTTLVCVLFVASTMSTINGYCLWLLPCLVLVCTTVVCVLFVATPTSSISVYYCTTCTVCGQYHVYY